MLYNEIKATKREKLSDWLAGYIAGMIDGEGTIVFGKRKAIYIYNTNLQALSIIQVFAGGKISPSGASGLVLSFRKAEQKWLLPQIIPYLIIKKQKAIDLFKQV